MRRPTVLSLFSGLGAFELGFERRGFRVIAQCENEPKAASVLKHHWPDVPLVGDIRELRGGDYPADVIIGGSPCQDLSVAGARKGLVDGERSSLFFEYARIIEEMQEATAGEYPRYVLFENVPGLLSSGKPKRSDFRIVLETFLQADLPMPSQWAYAGMARSGEREVCWRLLDSQHFGVAQRRKRVFVVLGLGGRSAAEVLLEREGVPGHPPQGREAGESITGTLEARTTGGGFPGLDFAVAGGLIPEVANALTAREGKGPDSDATTTLIPVGFNWQNGGNEGLAMREDGVGPLDTSQTKAVVYPIQDSKRINKNQGGLGVGKEGDPSYTIDTTGAQAVAFAENSRAEVHLENGDGQTVGNITSGGEKPGQGYPAVAFAMRGREEGNVPEKSGEQVSALRGSSGGSTRDMVAFGIFDEQTPKVGEDIMPTLRSRTTGGGAMQQVAAPPKYAVRRLTPRECERLQNFPDDWTRFAADGSEVADTHRYRMIGNAVTVSVVEWIAAQVARELAAERLEEAA